MILAPAAIKLIPATAALLSFVLVTAFPFPLLFADNIKIVSWNYDYVYEAKINGEPVVIHLEETEKEIEKDKPEHHPKPGKIKIVFEDSKQKGTKLIYERDMEDGAISETDRIYIERVLNSIEKFHKENHSFNGKVKDTINNFLNSIKNKK